MARGKRNGAAPPADAGQADDDDAAEAGMRAATDVAVATIGGDMRDFILDRLRHEQNKLPWHERSEAEQRDAVNSTETACREMVARVVELIAGAGRPVIRATLASVTVKDGIKAVLELSGSDRQRHALFDSQGSVVLIVVADAEPFLGERAAVTIKPDQGTLAMQQAAENVQTEDEAQAEFDRQHMTAEQADRNTPF